ncbi:hypothetical protein J4419_05910 [Candidatus Woesearchaeota archaeon]|nr:hypothetical protein [Candidatus Woesearchaeota archaeon]
MSLVDAIVLYERQKTHKILEAVTELDPTLRFSTDYQTRMAMLVANRVREMAMAASRAGPLDLADLMQRSAAIDEEHGIPTLREPHTERSAWIEQVTLFYRGLMVQVDTPMNPPQTDSWGTSPTYDLAAQAMGEARYREHMRRIDGAEESYFGALNRLRRERRRDTELASAEGVLHPAQVLVREREAQRIFGMAAK